MLNKQHLSRLFACSCLALTLTACQTMTTIQPQKQQQQQTLEDFYLQGKIGVRTPQQSGSAFYTWQQQQEQFNIELTGILGIGRTIISNETGKVSLQNSQVGEIYADTPEELLLQATGWSAPISHLKYWVNAKPATTNAIIQYDNAKRPTQISEDGWSVELEYNTDKLPNRLTLTQALNSTQQNRIILTIQNR